MINKLIVVQLIGGLGNQMFQYALGRYLAQKTGFKLKLDITEFGTYELHAFSLSHFNIIKDFASDTEINTLKYGHSISPLIYLSKQFNRAYNRMTDQLFFKTQRWVQELYFHFNPQILNLNDSCFLQGYWQSEKYFKPIRDLILNDFTIQTPISSEAQAIQEEILKSNAISVHIRRGDYINNPVTAQTYSCCSMQYYEAAVKLIQQRTDSPRFFIFSDDPDWVKRNFSLQNSELVEGNAAKNYEDLHLMSLCRHNIIANSSFSWWGAWLNRNPDKLVIAPQTWFNNSKFCTKDLIPDEWIQL